MILNNDDHDKMLDLVKTIFDAALIIALYTGGVLALNMPIDLYNDSVIQVAVIAGASLAGAVTLAYYRRELSYKEMLFKTGTAALCGLVIGAVLTKRWNMEAPQYVMATYYFASLLSLFFIRGLLSVTEQNASGLVISIFQRVLNTQGIQNAGLKITPDTQVIKTDVVVKKDSTVTDATAEVSAEKIKGDN